MINLIVGNKGTGKTKKLVDMVNTAVEKSSGNVVCVEKGMKLTYDLSHAVRLIDAENYNIVGFDAFYGFLTGLLAGNYDITDLFVDGTFKIGGRDYQGLGAMLDKLNEITKEGNVKIVFTISCDESDLPQEVKKYI